jgi:hypothetical protein
MTGHCLCGAVTLRVLAHDPRVGACHCRMCQRWSGGLFPSFAAREVQVRGQVARYRSSPFAERAFCPVSGTHLWMRDVEPDGEAAADAPYELMPGLFDAARDWPLRSEIYTDRALACLRLEGDHRRATRAEYEATHAHIEGDMP